MVFQQGNYYHLYNRGCNKDLIFRDKSDYSRLLKYFQNSRMKDYLNLCAFSLMPNHYHFLVEQTTEKSVTMWIRYIFNQYTQYFNKKYNRSGTLFESRVKSKEIDKQEYMSMNVHYIHNNPDTDEMKKFCSITMLNHSNNLISEDFYDLFFDGIAGYFESFSKYSENKKELEIDDWLKKQPQPCE